LVVYCETNPEKLKHSFKKSIDLLNYFDTIYFTESESVATFVHQKQIFKLVQTDGFEHEIKTINEERKRKIELSISEFEKENQKLEDDRKRLLEDYKAQIENNEKLHLENKQKIEESKSDLNKLNKYYSEFSIKINDFANQLRSGKKLDEIRILYNENKKLFVEGINQLKKPDFINKIAKASAKSGLSVESQYSNHEFSHRPNRYWKEEEENKIDIFKVGTLVLLLLLIGTWIFFLFFNTREESNPFIEQQEVIDINPEPLQKQPSTTVDLELKPKPNAELSENDYRLLAKKLKHNISIDEVTKIIFEKNPTDVKSNYVGQETIYAKNTLQLNKNCFEEKDGVFYFTKDTLRHIPSYKKLN
jgi:hypothetical protein